LRSAPPEATRPELQHLLHAGEPVAQKRQMFAAEFV